MLMELSSVYLLNLVSTFETIQDENYLTLEHGPPGFPLFLLTLLRSPTFIDVIPYSVIDLVAGHNQLNAPTNSSSR